MPYMCLFILLFFSTIVSAEPLVVGQSAALIGPSGKTGREVQRGLHAAFVEANHQNGVKGRSVVLVSRDDSYEPYRAVRNANELLDRKKAVVLIGNVGTPTTESVLSKLTIQQPILFGPITGALGLRYADTQNVVNIRASYAQELTKIIQYITEIQGASRIACFYQNDSYGKSNLKSLKNILTQKGLGLVAEAHYQRNTLAVLGALKKVHSQKPEAVIIIGSYRASAEFIRLAKLKFNSEASFYNLSFAGAVPLKTILKELTRDVYVSVVVPMIWDTSNPLVVSYHSALKNIDKNVQPSFLSFEGYITGRLFVEVARRVKGPVIRETIMDTIAEERVFTIDGNHFCLVNASCDVKRQSSLVSLFQDMKKVH